MRRALLISLLLSASPAAAAGPPALSNGAPLILEQDTRGVTETLVYHFETGASEAGPAQQAALSALQGLVFQDTGSLSGQLLHLQASLRLGWDARGISAAITAPPDNMPQALALLAGELRHPHVDEKHLAWGRAGLISNAKGSLANPGEALAWSAQRAIFGGSPDHLPGRPSPAEAGSVSADALSALLPVLFDPQLLSFGAAGPADEATVRAWLETDLKAWDGPVAYKGAGRARPKAAARPRGVVVMYLDRKDLPEDHYLLLVPQTMAADPRGMTAARFVQFLLGGGGDMESLLWDRLRQEKGWTYSTSSFAGADNWGIQGHGDPAHLKDLLKALPGIIDGLAQAPPDAAHFEQIRRKLDAQWRRQDVQAVDRLSTKLDRLRWYGDPDMDDKMRAQLPQLGVEDLLSYERTLSLANVYLCLAGDKAHLRQVVKDLDWNVRSESELPDPALEAAK